MKNLIKKTKEKAVKLNRCVTAGFMSLMFMICSAVPASAVTINPNATTEGLVGGIIDVVLKVAFYIGFVLAAVGVFTFIFAFKDDNAESQSRGARLTVIGVVLIGLEVIIKLTGLVS